MGRHRGNFLHVWIHSRLYLGTGLLPSFVLQGSSNRGLFRLLCCDTLQTNPLFSLEWWSHALGNASWASFTLHTWIAKYLPSPVVSTLVLLTALPVSHWFTGEWAVSGG
jgi:hypothetical protein